jgi:hypothetical protein
VVQSVGPSGAAGIVDFAGATGELLRLRLACPFRIGQGKRIILGSSDLQVAYDGPSGDLPRVFGTVYDLRAFALSGILGAVRPVISDVEPGEDGSLQLSWGASYALTAFPAGSGAGATWVLSRH